MKKVLIVRFSSIGDIVLTTPVIRCVKHQLGAEVHYASKRSFKGILETNPNIDMLHLIDKDVSEITEDLKKEDFDFVIDLHNNLRSHSLIRSIKVPSASFRKYNLQKWILVNFKINLLPDVHIVERYMDAAKNLGVENDGKGLDYFIPEADKIPLDFLPDNFENYVGFVIGGQHDGKMCSEQKIISLCKAINKPVVLLGGPEDKEKAERITVACGSLVYNAAGKFSLSKSAWLVYQAEAILTHDTGLMHIAAAFKKRTVSLWGGTVPELGMYPYMPGKGSEILEVNHLMRPSSKLGTRKGIYRLWNFIDMIPNEKIVIALKLG